MKKTFRKGKRCAKKVISVLLAYTMVFAMFGICASATENTILDYKGLNLTNTDLINKVTTIADKDIITTINISDNPQITDISAVLQLLPNLNTISAENCNITDLTCLSYFYNSVNKLEYLNLNNNNIYDLTPLESIGYAVKNLYLENNKITNIYPLYKVDSTYNTINLNSNYISDARILINFGFEKNAIGCYIANNYINDHGDIFEGTKINLGTQNAIPAKPYLFSSDKTKILGYYGGIVNKNIQIPQTADDNITEIEEIGFRAFKENMVIESVSIPGTIATVGYGAFSTCLNLKRVMLENGIETIARRAFMRCDSLSGISIPESVKTIDQMAFRSCKRLKSVELSNPLDANNYNLHQWAFEDCDTDLLTVYVNPSIDMNGNSNLATCVRNLVRVRNRPETSITYDNTSLTTHNGELTSMSADFVSGSLLIKIPAGITEVDIEAPITTSQINSIVIPEGVTDVDLSVDFANDVNLSVLLPNTVNNTSEFNLSSSNNSDVNVTVYCLSSNIAAQNFANVNNYSVNNDYDISYDILNKYVAPLTQPVELVLPQNLGYDIIGELAFYPDGVSNAQNVTKVTIPESVTKIGDSAFRRCENLEDVDFAGSSNVAIIDNSAFYMCTALETIELPNSVEEIGAYSFSKCYNLETIQFGDNDGANITELGAYAFYYCISLKNTSSSKPNYFYIPEGITYINENLFRCCYAIKNIVLPDNIVSNSKVSNLAFKKIKHMQEPEDITNVYIYASNTSLANYIYYNTESYVLTDVKSNIQNSSQPLVANYIVPTGYTLLQTIEIDDDFDVNRFYIEKYLEEIMLYRNEVVL